MTIVLIPHSNALCILHTHTHANNTQTHTPLCMHVSEIAKRWSSMKRMKMRVCTITLANVMIELIR